MYNYTDDTKFQIGGRLLIFFNLAFGSSLLTIIWIYPGYYFPLFCAGFSCVIVATLGLELRRRSQRRLILEKQLQLPSYIRH